MGTGFPEGWTPGTGLLIAGLLVALWYLGRPFLRLMAMIGRFFGRIAGAIQRFFQPIFEFIYRSAYIIFHVSIGLLLGLLAAGPLLSGAYFDPVAAADAGIAAVVILVLAVLVFRHFRKYPLRKGKAQGMANDVMEQVDTEELMEDLDLDFGV